MDDTWRDRLRSWVLAERGRRSELHFRTRLALATITKFLDGEDVSVAVEATLRAAHDSLVPADPAPCAACSAPADAPPNFCRQHSIDAARVLGEAPAKGAA